MRPAEALNLRSAGVFACGFRQRPAAGTSRGETLSESADETAALRLPDSENRKPIRLFTAAANDSAFTLIELLTVMAIIALLAAILLPTLNNSKAAARRVECLNNLRQMGIAARLYVDDHADFYPIAYYEEEVAGVNHFHAWDLTTIEGSPNHVVPGILWQGQGNLRVQQCPSFSGNANWETDPFTGYNYNTSFIGHGQYESIPEPAKASAVHHATRTALFGDGQFSAGANKFMRAPWSNPGDESFTARSSGTQGFRHQKRSNTAFCDGHSETVKNCFTTTSDSTRVAANTGFLSADNSAYDLE